LPTTIKRTERTETVTASLFCFLRVPYYMRVGKHDRIVAHADTDQAVNFVAWRPMIPTTWFQPSNPS
jgi:hypothetical protein